MRSQLMKFLPAFAVVCIGTVAAAQDPVRYRIAIDPVRLGSYEVTMDLGVGEPGAVEIMLPAWTFGETVLNKAYRDITGLEATNDKGERLRVGVASGERSWMVSRNAKERLIISYVVRGVRSTTDVKGYFMKTAALVEGPVVFLHQKGGRQRPCTLEVTAPSSWTVASSLASGGEPGTFRAPNYDALVDAATVAGQLTKFEIEEGGIKHRIYLDPMGTDAPVDTSSLQSIVKKVLKGAHQVMGAPPFRDYLFLFIGSSSESLAHVDSAVVGLGTGRRAEDLDEAIRRGARAYVEAWNGKRFRPKPLRPYTFAEECRTRSLWMTQGVSDYLASLVLAKAGVVSREATLDDLSHSILEHRNHHLAASVSPEDASWNVWDHEGDASLGIAPELPGRLLGLIIDIRIRSATENKSGLPDAIQKGLELHGQDKGYEPKDLASFLATYGGEEITTLFKQCIAAPGALPLDEVLPLAGLEFEWFKWKIRDPQLRSKIEQGKLVVGELPATSPLYLAGLRAGDELMLVNQKKVRTPNDVDRVLARLKPGQRLRLDVRHNKKHRNIRLQVEDDTSLVIPVEERSGEIVIKSVPPGPLAKARIEVGDVLEKIDKRRITQVTDVAAALRRIKKGKVLLQIKRGGKRKKIKVAAPRRVYWRGSLGEDPKADKLARDIRKSLFGS